MEVRSKKHLLLSLKAEKSMTNLALRERGASTIVYSLEFRDTLVYIITLTTCYPIQPAFPSVLRRIISRKIAIAIVIVLSVVIAASIVAPRPVSCTGSEITNRCRQRWRGYGMIICLLQSRKKPSGSLSLPGTPLIIVTIEG